MWYCICFNYVFNFHLISYEIMIIMTVSPKVVFIFLSERNMNSFISGVDSLSSMYLLQVCFYASSIVVLKNELLAFAI